MKPRAYERKGVYTPIAIKEGPQVPIRLPIKLPTLLVPKEQTPVVLKELPPVKIIHTQKLPSVVLQKLPPVVLQKLPSVVPQKLPPVTLKKQIAPKQSQIRNVYIGEEEKIKMNPKYKLHAHQMEAIEWMRKREMNKELSGGILCMKQGLGKTLISQVLALSDISKKTLIVCSKTVIGEWKNEQEKFFGNQIKVLYWHTDYIGSRSKLITRRDIDNVDFVVTTYEVVTASAKKLKGESNGKDKSNGKSVDNYIQVVQDILETQSNGSKSDKIIGYRSRINKPDLPAENTINHLIHLYPWGRIIIDEGQCLANWKCAKFIPMLAVYAPHRWVLSGTPVRNSDKDMWSLLKFIGYDDIVNPKDWKYSIFEESRILKSVILVHDYETANIKMPEKKVHVHNIEMTDEQKRVYAKYLNQIKELYALFEQGLGNHTYMHVLALFTRLRQTCIAPYLTTKGGTRSDFYSSEEYEIPEDISQENSEKKDTEIPDDTSSIINEFIKDKMKAGILCGKIPKIVELVSEIVEKGQKVLIYSTYSTCLDLIYDALQENNPERDDMIILDGKVTGPRRQEFLKEFRENESYKILLSNYRVGAEGLNLTQANHIICVEPWWSHTAEAQAISRAWRMGQTQEVHVHRIIMKGSIEDGIVKICEAKESIMQSYLQEGTSEKRQVIPKLDAKTLGEILRYSGV